MRKKTNMSAAVLAVAVLFCAAALAQDKNLYPMADGKYKPSYESLKQYQYPDWYRDAKFGIWAHWGPQAVPMDGDWYARGMYEQGSGHNKYHLAHYGPPSKFGYKDIIPLWKAEKWDPDRLMQLYKKAGAKYFVSMGSHHDNFFLWNSKLHKWNAANMGPKRDVVGDWQKAAKKYGLRFGVSEHLGASFTWFQSSHRSDRTGPLAGVPYDGADPQYEDLYHFAAKPGDRGWYSNDPRWQQQWYNEIKELVDNYHPDLLYSDGPVPFGNEAGLSMIAHLYNGSAARNGGAADAVYNCKQKSDGRWVQDLERGVMAGIDPNPWQTDTSIGDWFYNRNWKFRPVSWVIHMLVDNVSKNGNLLLNVVQRPDGSLDPEVEQMLAQLADWTAVHGEAIHGSRPWLICGEGPALSRRNRGYNENYSYSAQDIRFTTKGGTLYAIALDWPVDGKLVVHSLAKPTDGGSVISDVSLLGYDGKIQWQQTADGLLVTLPEKKVSPYTCGLKITGTDLKPARAASASRQTRTDAKGVFHAAASATSLDVEPKKPEPVEGFRDTPMLPGGKWHVHDPDRPQPPVVTPAPSFSQNAPAPSDAEVLFDGTDLSKWQNARGQDAPWIVRDGYMETAQRQGIRTRGKWADFQLHVEFATPVPAKGTGQARGNSGVLINNMYEVQILDSYKDKTYPDGQCAAIYGQSPPLVNASKAPGEWQTYDIVFESPRWNDEGKLEKKAVVTVLHNGLVVQNHYELIGTTDGIGATPWRSLSKYSAPHPPEVFIELQYHNNPVRFRNIWIRKLGI